MLSSSDSPYDHHHARDDYSKADDYYDRSADDHDDRESYDYEYEHPDDHDDERYDDFGDQPAEDDDYEFVTDHYHAAGGCDDASKCTFNHGSLESSRLPDGSYDCSGWILYGDGGNWWLPACHGN